MNNLQEQFLGFYNTPKLFSEIKSLKQFEFEYIDIDDLEYNLQIEKKLPLGKRVEYFFEYYINQTNRYKLLYKNIQVLKEKETLGELDFILYDEIEDKYLHTELVYKYYLYDESYELEIDRYIGPNRNDTLVKKLNKLSKKQFPLLFNDEVKKYIDIEYNNVYQNTCFKANVYLPYKKKCELSLVNKECVKGFYINIEEFKLKEEFKKYKYYLPHRYDWVRQINKEENYLEFEEAIYQIEYFLNLKKSPLIWLKDDEVYKEFFITWW